MSIQNNCLNTYSMNKYLMDLVYASIEWVNPVAVLRHGYVFFVHGRKRNRRNQRRRRTRRASLQGKQVSRFNPSIRSILDGSISAN